MGVNHVIVVDLHCGQIQGFFPSQVPCDNVAGGSWVLVILPEENLKDLVIVVPMRWCETCKVLRILLYPNHKSSNCNDCETEKRTWCCLEHESHRSVQDSDCIIVDDMIDTAGTLKAARLLKDRGARNVYAFASHGVFSGPAYERIRDSVLKEVVILDTMPLPKGQIPSQITQISVSSLVAEAIRRSRDNESVLSISMSRL